MRPREGIRLVVFTRLLSPFAYQITYRCPSWTRRTGMFTSSESMTLSTAIPYWDSTERRKVSTGTPLVVLFTAFVICSFIGSQLFGGAILVMEEDRRKQPTRRGER